MNTFPEGILGPVYHKLTEVLVLSAECVIYISYKTYHILNIIIVWLVQIK